MWPRTVASSRKIKAIKHEKKYKKILIIQNWEEIFRISIVCALALARMHICQLKTWTDCTHWARWNKDCNLERNIGKEESKLPPPTPLSSSPQQVLSIKHWMCFNEKQKKKKEEDDEANVLSVWVWLTSRSKRKEKKNIWIFLVLLLFAFIDRSLVSSSFPKRAANFCFFFWFCSVWLPPYQCELCVERQRQNHPPHSMTMNWVVDVAKESTNEHLTKLLSFIYIREVIHKWQTCISYWVDWRTILRHKRYKSIMQSSACTTYSQRCCCSPAA